jgi:predicted nuclease with TOPRIM domain
MGHIEVDWVVLGLAILAGFRALVTMKEQIKTLFSKLEEKDKAIDEIKKSIKDLSGEISALKDAQAEGQLNIVNLLNEQYIKLSDKIAEVNK